MNIQIINGENRHLILNQYESVEMNELFNTLDGFNMQRQNEILETLLIMQEHTLKTIGDRSARNIVRCSSEIIKVVNALAYYRGFIQSSAELSNDLSEDV